MSDALTSMLASSLSLSLALPQSEEEDTSTDGKPLRIQNTSSCAYLYDGSLEGLLSAVFAATLAHAPCADIVSTSSLQPRLGQSVVTVATNMQHALRVRRSILRSHGEQAFEVVRIASASDDPDIGGIVYRFILHALTRHTGCSACPKRKECLTVCDKMPHHSPLLDDLGDPCVWPLVKASRAVMNERHRMTQFIRFQQREGDVWFARCNPNASVVPLLMDWFVPRFNDQKFVIYDENHTISGVYDGRKWYLVSGDSVTPPPKSGEEDMMQKAWRTFYDSLTIEARYHPELRRSFMPMRLWKNITEVQDLLPSSRTAE